MRYLLIFIFPAFLFANEVPIDFSIQKKKGNNYTLTLLVPKGYAIQKDAPNKIQLKGDKTLNVVRFKSDFKGQVYLDKPEYYETLQPMPLVMRGKGELSIDAKLFYCELSKGLCFPGKISKKEQIN